MSTPLTDQQKEQYGWLVALIANAHVRLQEEERERMAQEYMFQSKNPIEVKGTIIDTWA